MARGLVIEMTGEDADIMRRFAKLEGKMRETEARMRELGNTSRRTSKDMSEGFGSNALASLQGYLAGLITVGAAWRTIAGSSQEHLRILTAMAGESAKAAKEMITLAALQEGGEMRKNVQSAAALARSYGITDRATAFDVVQSMQSSRGGSFQKGMMSANEIFAASLVGLPLEIGQDVETKGAAVGAGPGQFARMTEMAGRLSAAKGADIGKGVAGIQFFKDSTLGFSAASVLVDLYKGEMETYLKGAGRAIGATIPKQLQRWMKKEGLTGASQMDILRRLHERGIDTPEQMAKLGVTELREMQGLATLSKNFPKVEENYAKIAAAREDKGFFGREYERISGLLPNVELTRERDQLIGMAKDVSMFDPSALREENSLRTMGVALKRMGRQSLGPIPLLDQDDMPKWYTPELISVFGLVQEIGRALSGGKRISGLEGMTLGRGEKSELEKLESHMETAAGELQEMNRELKRQTGALERSPAGPLKYPPGVEPGGFGVPNYQPSVF